MVETAATYAEADRRVSGYDYDCILLDIMLPDGNGLRLLERIKELRRRENVIIVSARDSLEDKVLGLDRGADDYLSKPFSYAELISRVKSLLRRYYVYKGKTEQQENELTCGDIRVDTDKQSVKIGEKEINLTDIEYKILALMLSHRKKVFSAQNLFESIWEEPYFYSANNTVMVHIRNLRKKLEKNPQNPQYIKTAWGKGYFID